MVTPDHIRSLQAQVSFHSFLHHISTIIHDASGQLWTHQGFLYKDHSAKYKSVRRKGEFMAHSILVNLFTRR